MKDKTLILNLKMSLLRTTELTTDVVKAEPTTELTTDVVKAAKTKKTKQKNR